MFSGLDEDRDESAGWGGVVGEPNEKEASSIYLIRKHVVPMEMVI